MVALVPWRSLAGGSSRAGRAPDTRRRRDSAAEPTRRRMNTEYEVLLESGHAARADELLGKADEQWRRQ